MQDSRRMQDSRLQVEKDDDLLWEPLPGAIVPQFIRCGKPSCRCSAGEGHGPYYYRVWREGPKVCKEYVKATQVESVRQQMRLYEEMQSELRRLVQLRRSAPMRLVRRRVLRWQGQQSTQHQGDAYSVEEQRAIQVRLAGEAARSSALSSRAEAAGKGVKTSAEEALHLIAEARRVVAASRQLRAGYAEQRRQRAEAPGNHA